MPITSTQIVLREAKRLHRAATSDSLSSALPVLRRLIAAGAVPVSSLPKLFRLRHTVQRKHVLRTLALEAGHESWEAYRPKIEDLSAQQFESFEVMDRGYANLNLWFASQPEAQQFAAKSGGRVVRVGGQAVVLPKAVNECLSEPGV